MAPAQYVAAGSIMVAVTVAVALWMAVRTRSARRQLELMHAAAHHPSRRLVEVLRLLRCSHTGRLVLVLDVLTGKEGTVWLPLNSLQSGELALLVWMDRQWVLMDRLPARRLRLAGATRRRTLTQLTR